MCIDWTKDKKGPVLLQGLLILVGRAGVEPTTNGLKGREESYKNQ